MCARRLRSHPTNSLRPGVQVPCPSPPMRALADLPVRGEPQVGPHVCGTTVLRVRMVRYLGGLVCPVDVHPMPRARLLPNRPKRISTPFTVLVACDVHAGVTCALCFQGHVTSDVFMFWLHLQLFPVLMAQGLGSRVRRATMSDHAARNARLAAHQAV